MLSTMLLCTLILLLRLQDVSSLAFFTTSPSKQLSFVSTFTGHQRRKQRHSLLSHTMEAATSATTTAAEPHFHARRQISTTTAKTAGFKTNRIAQCADERGLCDIDEMMEMMEELKRLNKECCLIGATSSPECSVEAFDARSTLKDALATNIALEEALEECPVDLHSDDPYWDMYLMHDECLNSKMQMHQIPTTTAEYETELDHMVECAENSGQCDVQDLTQMIDELERLNLECHEIGMSRECSLDAVEARNILKVALASQIGE